MFNAERTEEFIHAASAWVLDNTSLVIRYLILRGRFGIMQLRGLTITAGPVPTDRSLCFSVESEDILAGFSTTDEMSKADIIKVLRDASEGVFYIGEDRYYFPDGQLTHFSEPEDDDRWEYDLTLMAELRNSSQHGVDTPRLDRVLRTLPLPFDGLSELISQLGLSYSPKSLIAASAELRIKPPLDCLIPETYLSDDRLTLTLASHKSVDISSLCVALRPFPGEGIHSREQIASQLEWNPRNTYTNFGKAIISVAHADAVLVMVSFAGKTVRRQWFNDPVKARNLRTVASRNFDPDLKQLKKALLSDNDSPRFELAFSSLIFLLGMSPAIQVETESPDIIAMTPAGRLVIVECTLKTSDFRTKLGKLVDRQKSLKQLMARSNHFVTLHAVLVCRTPREQIMVDNAELQLHGVLLIAQEELVTLLGQVNFANDPDAQFERIESRKPDAA